MSAISPLLSIAIPTYQRAGLLKRALTSALKEATALGAKAEVLVLDNGSTDGSREWLRSLPKQPGLRVIYQKRNLGMVGNWNSALRLARGRYLTLLHDDDALLPGWAEAVLAAHQKHPDCGFSFGAFKVLRTEGLAGKVYRPLGRQSQTLSSATAFAWIAVEFCSITAATVVLDRARLLRLGGFRPQAALAADGDAYLRLAAQAPVLYRAGVHAGFGFHGGNLQLSMTDSRTAVSIGRILSTAPWPRALGTKTTAAKKKMLAMSTERQAFIGTWAALQSGRVSAAQAAGWDQSQVALRTAGLTLTPAGLRRSVLRLGLGLPGPLRRLVLRTYNALERRLRVLRPSPASCLQWMQGLAALTQKGS